jgi:GAF domain-containing protein
MKTPCPFPINESQRLDALRRSQLLEAPWAQCFDDFTVLANAICQTPIAAITLIDERRQWFKSVAGLKATALPRSQSFCAHTIMQRELLVVEDTTRDSRFASNPMVTASPGFRFYAGAPLRDDHGNALGTLFVVDRQPRKLSPMEQNALHILAGRVMVEIQYRMLTAVLGDIREGTEATPSLLPICCHCKAIRHEGDRWETVETFIGRHLPADFSHGVCDGCLDTHYPESKPARQRRNVIAAA